MKYFLGATAPLALLAILLGPESMYAQAVENAQIHGSVQDASGAVIAGAQIRATKIETGQVRTTISGSDGSYVFPNLAVGSYRVEVSAPSFGNYVQSGITLQVGTNVEVDVALQLGTVTQQVQVAADAAMVETQDTSVSQVIDQRRITELPLNGRQATDLILLSGGAAMPPNSSRVITTHDYSSAVGVSVSGGQINGNNFLLDGADHNDSHSNVNLPYPFPDALQEFNVQTGGVSSRYGLHPGSVVNVVTKSGTNQIHGNLFEFVRNGAFNARNFFAASQDTLRRNQFGGTLGGPIKRDKLFLFGGYQGPRERTAPPQSVAFVPTQSALAGDFSVLESAACQSNRVTRQLINPSNGQPFANNFISPSLFTPPAVALLKNVPVSNDPCGRYVYSIPNPNNENQYVTRADWIVSSNHTIFGRYFLTDFDNPSVYQGNLLTTTRAGLQERSQSVVLGDQLTLGPTLVNAFHLTFSRLAINRIISGGMPSPASLGVNMYNAAPNFTDLSLTNYFSVGGGSNAPAFFIRNQWQVADDVDWTHGSHHFSMGVDAIAIQMNERNIQFANGEFAFNGSFSRDSLADFLLGRPSSLTQSNIAEIGLRQKYVGLYAQDDIRLSKTFNVHVGVRWEPFLPEYDIAGKGSTFSLPDFVAGKKTSLYNNAPPGLFFHGDPGIPQAYANSRYLDFAPRVGFAWSPGANNKQSIRGAYGIFYDSPESFTIRDFAITAPWGNQITLTAPGGGFANPYGAYPGGNPFPSPYPPTQNAPFPLQGSYINMPLNLHHPYVQQWNFSIERQLGANWLVSATYLGNKATHLRSSTEQNPAVYVPGASTVANTASRRLLTRLNPVAGPYYSTITIMDDGVNTSYNSLRLSAQHRFSHNFTSLVVYTYSHCLQNAETLSNRLTGNNYANPYNRNMDKGPCDFDLRHNLTGSLVYPLPTLPNRFINQVFGNWQLAVLVTARTGFPFNPTTGVDNSLTGVGLDRPLVTGDPYLRNTDTLQWLNASSFRPNPAGTFGTAGANSLLAPGFFNADANLTRYFKTFENQRFELRFEFFNVLNHTNFNAPVSRLSSSTFGTIQSAAASRLLQFALKYQF